MNGWSKPSYARKRCHSHYLSAINKLFEYTTEQITKNLTQLSIILSPEKKTEISTPLKEGYMKAAKKNLTQTAPIKKGQDKQGIKKYLAA